MGCCWVWAGWVGGQVLAGKVSRAQADQHYHHDKPGSSLAAHQGWHSLPFGCLTCLLTPSWLPPHRSRLTAPASPLPPRAPARPLQLVKASVPLSEMFNYVSTLRGMTKGRAQYTMQVRVRGGGQDKWCRRVPSVCAGGWGCVLPCCAWLALLASPTARLPD